MMHVLAAIALADLAVPSGGAACSASEIARTTAIPRQTVIRKLASMAGRGWVVRCTGGLWALDRSSHPPKVARDLGSLWESNIGMIAGMVADVVARQTGLKEKRDG